MFRAKYAPGTLTAAAYDETGRELSRSELHSAAGAVRICAEPEETTIKAGEIVYIPISLTGENGVVESNADRKLTVWVKGGELLGFGSANPCTKERYDAGSFTTYQGRALAVVRAGQAGTLTLTVTDGKLTEKVEINVR